MNNTLSHIAQELSNSVCSAFSFYERRGKVYLISPFYYDDGDGLHIVIDQTGEDSFVVSDEGNSMMRLSYDLDINQINTGTRKNVIDSLVGHYGATDRLGEFIIESNEKNLSDALFRMIHLCIRISDIDFLSKPNVKNTFIEDFKRESQIYFGEAAEFDWYDRKHDKSAEYSVDIFIKQGNRQIGIFPMYTNHQVMSNTISVYQLRKWGHDFNFLGVVQDKDKVSDSSLRKFSDAAQNIYYLNNYKTDTIFHTIEKHLIA